MKTIKFVISILICLSAGFIGSIFTGSSVDSWYKTIIRPSFGPPNWIFAPVWTTLFVLMGIAFAIIWSSELGEEKKSAKKKALTVFVIQLFVNILWSLAFFGLKSPIFGLIVILILWFLILLTIIKFSKINKIAAYLLIPYILWVSFATVLNFAIWRLN